MMQHEKNPKQNRFIRFVKEKGYYIVLSLCLVAVGIAGYVFVTTAMDQNDQVQDPSLSVPMTATDPDDDRQSEEVMPSVRDQADTPVLGPADTEADQAVADAAAQTVIRPVSGNVLQDHAMDRLAYNPTTRDWRVHKGIDLAATMGQTVLAAKAGTVTAVYEDDYYGGTVVIRHDGGCTTHYANLSEASYVKAGDTVAAGDVIGTVGNSAMLELSQEPHLHFEVYQDGEPVDPEEFLP